MSVALILRAQRTRLGSARRWAASLADGQGPKPAWEARARKEAKGKDPYEVFGSTNTDVSVFIGRGSLMRVPRCNGSGL